MSRYGLIMERSRFESKLGGVDGIEHFRMSDDLEVVIGGESDEVEDMDKSVVIESVMRLPQVSSRCSPSDFVGLYMS